MFYPQKLPQNIKTNLKIMLSDFSKGINTNITQNLLPLNYAVNSYNFDFNRQSLSTGLGLKELVIPVGVNSVKSFIAPDEVQQILRFWQYTKYDAQTDTYIPVLMLYCDDENMYNARLKTNLNQFYPINSTFFDVPNGINYRIDEGDCFFACGEGKIVKYSGAVPVVYNENVPRITSVAMHAGRLFATVNGDQNVVWFSDDLDPTNWNVSNFEGGYIELTGERGVCKKVIEANNLLVVIREFGITKISGWGLQDNFVVKNMYLSTGRLYYETAKLCGRIIIILSTDGLYYFDGDSMNKINLGIEEMFVGVDNSSAIGAFLDGKYYLACKLNFDDGNSIGCEQMNVFKNNALIELDLNTFNYTIMRGVDIVFMDGIRGENFSKLGILINGQNSNKIYELTRDGIINGVPAPKYWVSPFTDMGYPNYKKVIRSLTINTATDIKITICADNRSYDFEVKGNKLPVRVPIDISCLRFNVAFCCTKAECEISNPLLQVSLV